jgi:hypothetical protein
VSFLRRPWNDLVTDAVDLALTDVSITNEGSLLPPPFSNPLSIAAGQVGRVALGAVDHVVIKRFPDAIALEAKVRASPAN